MKKIFYEKQGRRYVPVYEYDSTLLDSFPKGNHLVMVYPGGQSRRFNVDPEYAAMIAAGRVAEDVIAQSILKASEVKPRKKKLTEEQRQAWEALQRSFGDEIAALEWPSAADAARAAVKAMQEEADKLLSNPSVRLAWERFQMVCQLTKEIKND